MLAGRYKTLFVVLARQATLAGEIDSSESIFGLHKRLQIRALKYEFLHMKYRGGIFKLLRSPGIDSNESIPPAYVAWRAGTTTLFLFSSYGPHR